MLLLFVGFIISTPSNRNLMVPGLIRRQIVMTSVVNAHLNELPVKSSVLSNEGQDKLPTMYWLPKLHKTV